MREKRSTYRKVCCPVNDFRTSHGVSINHFKLNDQGIPLLPVFSVQLGKGDQTLKTAERLRVCKYPETGHLIMETLKVQISRVNNMQGAYQPHHPWPLHWFS